ncbi:MAG: hypothetical protein LUG18_00290 [Candidatus Azobacteroides sp.]|nr:hypothetical protein [Candidatus Azobacteroides sp.]
MDHFKAKKIGGFFIFMAAFAGIGAIVMLLWNALIPGIIGWTAISYWQAIGLMLLSRLLLGGFGRFHGRFGGHFGHNALHDHHKRFHEMRDKMQTMSREEKKEYILRRMATCNPYNMEETQPQENNGEENKDNPSA